MVKRIASLCGLLFVTAVYAQPGPGRNYDPAAVVTVTGKVTEVTTIPHGTREGIHLTVQSGNESITVMVGPSTNLEKHGIKFVKGDTVTITGSKQGNIIIAREITKAGQTLKLRTEAGLPLWRGVGR